MKNRTQKRTNVRNIGRAQAEKALMHLGFIRPSDRRRSVISVRGFDFGSFEIDLAEIMEDLNYGRGV